MIVSLILPQHLHTCIDDIRPLLERAVATSEGRYNLVDLLDELCRQQQLLWVCFEDEPRKYYAVCTVKITQYPRLKMITGVYVAGEELDKWRDELLDTLESFARDNDCAGIEMLGRAGWARKLKDRGWKADAAFYEMRV